jgi:hypothetical protein
MDTQDKKYTVLQGDKNTIKVLKYLNKFTSTYQDRPALNCLHVANPLIEAADGFTLAQTIWDQDEIFPNIFQFIADGLYKLILTGAGIIVLERQEMAVEYPKVNSIMDETKYLADIQKKGLYKFEFTIQSRYLDRLTSLLNYGEDFPAIKFWSGISNAPIYFENMPLIETMYGKVLIKGAIMPMHKDTKAGIVKVGELRQNEK